MGTNTAHALHLFDSSAPSRQASDLCAHGRGTFDENDIRVIAGGKYGQGPLHARAIPTPAPQPDRIARLRVCMQGVGFDLNTRERAFAFGAGTLFTIVALVAAIV